MTSLETGRAWPATRRGVAKMSRIPVLLCVLLLAAGCLERKDRAFFADDGIVVGTPKAVGADVFIPITFTTRIVHSGQWLYDVKTVVKDGEILVAAVFTAPPGERKSVYTGGITLERPEHERYAIVYLDSDGTRHALGALTMPTASP